MAEFESSIRVNDPDIQVEQVKDQVASRIRARREEARAQGLDYDHLTDSDVIVPGSQEATTDLRARLRELDSMSQEIGGSLVVRDRQFPLLNRFFFGVEMLLHKLVVKYVNRMAGRQLVFDKSVTEVMADLVARLERIDANIVDIQKRMSELEKGMADLELLRKNGK